MCLYTNKVQQQSALWLCFIVMHTFAMLHQRWGNMYRVSHTSSSSTKHCAVSGNISMHLIFKLQATATGACLLSLVKHQPQQSLPTDMSQMSIGGSKPYSNKPYCNEPYCSKPVPWAVLCCITDHILLCWHHTIQCSRLSSIIRHKGATVIEDSRAQMCDIYTGCFTHPSAAWAALQSRWLFW